ALEVDDGVLVRVVDQGHVVLGGVDHRGGAGGPLGVALPGQVRGQQTDRRQSALYGCRTAGHDAAPSVRGAPGAARRLRRTPRVTARPATITSAGPPKIVP